MAEPATKKARKEVGAANMEWGTLGFEPRPMNGIVIATWKEGEGWSKPELKPEASISISVWAHALHYGQSVFEGQKVFHCKDGKVRIFNDKKNLERMNMSGERLMLPELPWDLWREAMDMVVKANVEFIPPYGSDCAMYVRPLLFGSSAQMRLTPASEVTFIIMATPVSGYYKAGSFDAMPGFVVEDFDRAAPKGVGHCKAAGNYAADLKAAADGKAKGFPIGLYLDPKERKYIEEFNSSNFVAIIGGKYVTPLSGSILPSITNQCLATIAPDLGIEVERRPIEFLKEVGNFEEVGAIGTAVVVSPVKSLTHGGKTWEFKSTAVLKKLHDHFRSIQVGDIEDKHGFLREIEI